MHCNITINTNLYNNCYHISSNFIFFLVIINYTANRYICNKYKIPYDCIQNIKLYDKYLSLTNLIAEEKVVEEFLQNDMTSQNLSSGIISLLKTENRSIIVKKYNMLINKLRNEKNPYDSAAIHIYD